MNFSSLNFAWFLPLVFLVYWLVLGRNYRVQNVWLLAMSYLFYGWWDWRFCFLLAGTTLITFGCALPTTHRKAWATLAVAVNIGTLALFKYFNFFGESLRQIFSFFGWAADWFTIEVLLPVGISFYTFQAISYSVDVYRGEVRPTRNIVAFAGFLSFFPQLVAGPIERSTRLLPQFLKPRSWDYARAVEGMRLMLWGLFKKCAVADAIAQQVDPLWDIWTDTLPLHAAFTAFIAFPIQLYADFSGYCDIARGAARLLGFDLMVNFRFPYFSRNVLEFWHRWHISLMEWFTRYVYIPMGGSRRGNRYVHVMAVFLLSGLWHGADWSFVIWGALCGLFYNAALGLKANRYRPSDTPAATRADLTALTATFMLYALPCLFFRAPSVEMTFRAFELLGFKVLIPIAGCFVLAWILSRRMWRFNFTLIFSIITVGAILSVVFNPATFLIPVFARRGLIAALLMFMVEWRGRNSSFALEVMPRRRWIRVLAYLALYLVVITTAADTGAPFIYFQF